MMSNVIIIHVVNDTTGTDVNHLSHLILRDVCSSDFCRCGGIGRHKGLKIPGSNSVTGSTPVSGTSLEYDTLEQTLGENECRRFIGYTRRVRSTPKDQ